MTTNRSDSYMVYKLYDLIVIIALKSEYKSEMLARWRNGKIHLSREEYKWEHFIF